VIRMTDTIRNDILDYAAQGWDTGSIAETLGCSRTTVCRVRRANGCSVSPSVHRLYDWDLVVELALQGCSTTVIADKLGISERQVQRIRVERHANATPRTPLLTDEDVARAGQMLDDGASYAEVQRTLGHTFETIARRFPGRGWTKAQIGEYNSATRRLRKQVDL